MTKVYIENANTALGSSIRIFPLTPESKIEIPEGFTPTDGMGLSFGVFLKPAPLRGWGYNFGNDFGAPDDE